MARQNICSINFVDERLRPLKTELLTSVEQAYRELYPDSHDRTTYWFFDEIHLVPEWEFFIDRLARKKNNFIFITGSTAEMTSANVASSLRGRPLVYELFPFSFNEILNKFDLNSQPVSPKVIPKIKMIAEDYLTRGGFPETLETDSKLTKKNTWRVLQGCHIEGYS